MENSEKPTVQCYIGNHTKAFDLSIDGFIPRLYPFKMALSDGTRSMRRHFDHNQIHN